MPGINQLGGAQTMMQSDATTREASPQSEAAALNATGLQESSADAVKPAKELEPKAKTNEDGRGPDSGARQFSQLARKSRQPDPRTGDLISLGGDEAFDITRLESPKLSLVAEDEALSKRQMLERALVDIFAKPANTSLRPRQLTN